MSSKRKFQSSDPDSQSDTDHQSGTGVDAESGALDGGNRTELGQKILTVAQELNWDVKNKVRLAQLCDEHRLSVDTVIARMTQWINLRKLPRYLGGSDVPQPNKDHKSDNKVDTPSRKKAKNSGSAQLPMPPLLPIENKEIVRVDEEVISLDGELGKVLHFLKDLAKEEAKAKQMEKELNDKKKEVTELSQKIDKLQRKKTLLDGQQMSMSSQYTDLSRALEMKKLPYLALLSAKPTAAPAAATAAASAFASTAASAVEATGGASSGVGGWVGGAGAGAGTASAVVRQSTPPVAATTAKATLIPSLNILAQAAKAAPK